MADVSSESRTSLGSLTLHLTRALPYAFDCVLGSCEAADYGSAIVDLRSAHDEPIDDETMSET